MLQIKKSQFCVVSVVKNVYFFLGNSGIFV